MRRAPATEVQPFTLKELGLATLLFAVLAIVLAYPLSIHPSQLRSDVGVDGDLGWWVLSWDAHAFLQRPWAIFDANIFYPDRYALAYGENIIGIAFFAAPIIWLTGNPPLATTLTSLLSAILCGLGAYVLTRRLGLSAAAAVVCGVIFECAPPRFFRLGQITLTNIQWIPFALAAAHAYLDQGRKRELRLAALFVTLQVLSSGHGAVFVTLALLLFGLYRLALGEPVLWRKRLRDLGVPGALLLLPSALALYPYYQVQQRVGLRRGLGSWDTDWVSFLASPSHFHRWLYEVTGASRLLASEVTLFPGIVAIVLGVAALVWRQPVADRTLARETRERAIGGLELVAMVLALVSAVLTAGSALRWRIGDLWIDWPSAAARALVLAALAAVFAAALGRWTSTRALAGIRRPLAIWGAAILAAVALQVARPAIGAGDGLKAEYFETADWTGSPAVAGVDTVMSAPVMKRQWGGRFPERFTARWTGYLTVGRAGKYTFSLTSDDGSLLFVDDNPTPIVDNGGSHGPATVTGTVGLDRGPHRVELRYAQAGGGAMLEWRWSAEGSRGRVVPGWALSQQPTSPGRALVARFGGWAYRLLAVTALVAALVAVVRWRSGRSRRVLATWADEHRHDAWLFYVILTLLTVGLALGPPFGLWQYVYWMPGFNFIRASSRFTLLALLGLAVLAGYGFDMLTKRTTARSRWMAAAVLTVLLVVEYAGMPMGFTATRYEIPPVDRWLATQPKPFAIAEVPVHSEQDQVDYMNHSTAHWQRTVQGYHGWRPAFHTELNEMMERFPDEASLARLNKIGVRYVVVHQERYSAEEWARVEDALARFAPRLRLEHAEGAGRVYSLVPAQDAPTD